MDWIGKLIKNALEELFHQVRYPNTNASNIPANILRKKGLDDKEGSR